MKTNILVLVSAIVLVVAAAGVGYSPMRLAVLLPEFDDELLEGARLAASALGRLPAPDDPPDPEPAADPELAQLW